MDKSTEQGRALQQGVPSEELTSRDRETEAEAEQGPSSSGSDAAAAATGSLDSLDEDAKVEGRNSRGQSTDEAEDTTTRMLQSAGKLVIPILSSCCELVWGVNQPGLYSVSSKWLQLAPALQQSLCTGRLTVLHLSA